MESTLDFVTAKRTLYLYHASCLLVIPIWEAAVSNAGAWAVGHGTSLIFCSCVFFSDCVVRMPAS